MRDFERVAHDQLQGYSSETPLPDSVTVARAILPETCWRPQSFLWTDASRAKTLSPSGVLVSRRVSDFGSDILCFWKRASSMGLTYFSKSPLSGIALSNGPLGRLSY